MRRSLLAALALVALAGCTPVHPANPPAGPTPTRTTSSPPPTRTTTTPPPTRTTSTPPPPVTVPASMALTVLSRKGDQENVQLAGGKKFRVFDNHSLAGDASVTHGVIVVHGTGRNAEGYFERASESADHAGADNAIIVSPWFLGDDDDDPKSGEATWENEEWKVGDGDVSSFEVADQLVATLSDKRRFPNLTSITLAGHSAGAQFTQRYATFGDAPSQPWAAPMQYLVMNPSSFVYLDDWRPVSKPCKGFNEYKYGLEDRSGYAGRLTDEQARARFFSRTVTIANGGDDTFDNGDLDTDCEANAQGKSRRERGEAFYEHYHAAHPEAALSYVLVPGVDHDSGEMLDSPAVWPALFGQS
jgi:hypothetical protein